VSEIPPARIDLDASHVGLRRDERELGPDAGCRIEAAELVDVLQAGPDRVVLHIRVRQIDAGILGRRRELRHLQRLVVDLERLAGAVQADPQVAVPVGAELACDRILHGQRELLELAGVIAVTN